MANSNKDEGLYQVNLPEIDARTFLLFVQTADAVLKYSEAVLTKAGLSLIKHMVLQLLQSHGGTLTQSEIARLTLREKHNITTLVRRLKRDRLIEVKKNITDKRSFNVIITQKGKQALLDTAPASRVIVKQVMSSIPDSSAAALERSLKRLRENAHDGLLQLSED
jgi:DNA-binding MarR family transcriptional regulator